MSCGGGPSQSKPCQGQGQSGWQGWNQQCQGQGGWKPQCQGQGQGQSNPCQGQGQTQGQEQGQGQCGKPSRVRYSLFELQDWYEKGNRKPLEDLMRAFKGIKEKDPSDKNSFFNLSGYHGLPYAGPGKFNAQNWGGYCNHGTILFPTWHRVYLYKLEEALRSIPGCENVTLPYWDQTDSYSMNNGIPWPLTVENFFLDGETIKNPLLSYTLQKQLEDLIITDGVDNSKPKGYETKRGPLSGRMDSANLQQTIEHNAKFPDHKKNVELLNRNVTLWLQLETASKWRNCLNAPNYTVFSNQTSADNYNESQSGAQKVEHLESPHNDIHAAVGGFPSMGALDDKISQEMQGAGGDMGEIDVAAFDPLFYFHHCNVDRVFWIWQKKYKQTDNLDIIKGDPGTKTREPMPGITVNTILSLDSLLQPFQKTDKFRRVYTSRDCINIETQLGYTYSVGSLEQEALKQPVKQQQFWGSAAKKNVEEQKSEGVKKCRISNLDRTVIKGTFVVGGFLPIPGQADRYLGSVTIFNRWNLQGCSNCQEHLKVKALFDIPNIPGLQDPQPYIRILSHEGCTAKDECVKNNPTCGGNKLLGSQFKVQPSTNIGGKSASDVVRQAQLSIV